MLTFGQRFVLRGQPLLIVTRRASAGLPLVVDDLFQAAVLEENVLAGNEAVGCRRERVGKHEDGRA